MSPTDQSPPGLPALAGAAATPEQLRRAQRLEEIGLLTSRMVHDLNNMLTPMVIAMPMLRSSLTDPSALSLMDSLESMVNRATGLVRQVQAYTRGEGAQLKQVMVRQLLEEIIVFARETFPRAIRVESKISADLWLVQANLGQLHQVLLNLCVNARNAMPQGGTLTLRAENCRLDEAGAALITGGRAGAFLVVEVDDTGTGISPVMIARMGEPFGAGSLGRDGTGLGLSIVREIVVSHAGFLEVRTAAGKGSSFRVYLPADEIPPAQTGRTTAAQPQPLLNSAA